MSLVQGSASQKRKIPDMAIVSQTLTDGERIRKRPNLHLTSQTLTDGEREVYKIIHSRKDMGIWAGDIKRETNLPDTVVKKSLKSLLTKNLIKEVPNIKNKGKKHYMAAEFEPSKEITGGEWYSEGSLDTEFINLLKDVTLRYIFKQKVATRDGVSNYCRNSGIFSVEISPQQIDEILRTLVLDDEIIEVKSSAYGDYANIAVGIVCYRCKSEGGIRGEEKLGAMASIPCGVCPRINFCSQVGIVSPRTCVHYQKWLDF